LAKKSENGINDFLLIYEISVNNFDKGEISREVIFLTFFLFLKKL
jgi:hypothetical protein